MLPWWLPINSIKTKHASCKTDLLRKLIGNFKVGIGINCLVGEVIRILLCEFGSLSLHRIVLVEVTSRGTGQEGSLSSCGGSFGQYCAPSYLESGQLYLEN